MNPWLVYGAGVATGAAALLLVIFAIWTAQHGRDPRSLIPKHVHRWGPWQLQEGTWHVGTVFTGIKDIDCSLNVRTCQDPSCAYTDARTIS